MANGPAWFCDPTFFAAPQGMSQEVFSSFYRFAYFICREPGKRNVQVRYCHAQQSQLT
jgi:hypothetical protein